MPFKKDSLTVITNRVYANYESRFKPLGKTPRYNLLKIFSAVDAGMYHQLLGDLDFLSKQLFPDSATGAYLRTHWSDRVTPLYASAASGDITITGITGRSVPAGLIFTSPSGAKYYTEASYVIGGDGTVTAHIKAEDTGSAGNLDAGTELSIASSVPAGVDSSALVADGGITGGSDAETDAAYLVRVLEHLRNEYRYGKSGDFALWAKDATSEVSAAWEYNNFGIFGALLIQVINGNQKDGVHQVGNIEAISEYLNTVAPPILFTVRTPEIISLNPAIKLLASEDTQNNRTLADSRIRDFLQLTAKPGAVITAGALRQAAIDGSAVTDLTVKLNGDTAGIVSTTVLQYPYIGDITWE